MTEDIEIQETRRLLDEARTALKKAAKELDDAKTALKWTRDKLVELEAEHRKTTMLLVKVVESPDPDDVVGLLNALDRPCGFVPCAKCQSAAATIRQYAKANDALRKGMTDGTDS